jgi:hypothetical protein
MDGINFKKVWHVNFKIKYEVNFGESIAVVGSIDDLGNWKEYKHHLIWSPDNIWMS